jgi:copper chaperone NosL
MKNKQFIFTLSIIIISLILSSCSKQIKVIDYGKDECDYCKMLIEDNRFGCVLTTGNGNQLKFDDVGCMISYAIVKNTLDSADQKFSVTVFTMPDTYVDAQKAYYVYNENFNSPMGYNVLAFDRDISSKDFIGENGGEEMKWDDVVNLVIETAQ